MKTVIVICMILFCISALIARYAERKVNEMNPKWKRSKRKRMKKKDIPSLQELAEFLRNAAYANNHMLNIDWRMSIVHPRLPSGDIGYSGGIWFVGIHQIGKEFWDKVVAQRGTDEIVSISFSYSESRGIENFNLFVEDRHESRKVISFEDFKRVVIDSFHIKKLYCPPSERGRT